MVFPGVRAPFAVPAQLDRTEHRDGQHGSIVGVRAVSGACQRPARRSVPCPPIPTPPPSTAWSQAALVADDADELLEQAAKAATTTRDRQVVAIATAHVHGNHELVDVLARDHLVDHPDSVLVASIAATSRRQANPNTTPSERTQS